MEVPDSLVDILTLTNIDPAIKLCSMDYLLGLTGSGEGLSYLIEHSEYMQVLCDVISKDTSFPMIEKALKCLLNLTADDVHIHKYIDTCPKLMSTLISHAFTEQKCVQLAFMVLANITRVESVVAITLTEINNHGGLQKLVEMLNRLESSDQFHYTASILSNLSQRPEARKQLMANKFDLFSKLLPFTTYSVSSVRRLGAVGAIRNCCFDTEYHNELLDDKLNVLVSLCLPLAGPDSLDEEDMEKLPLDLQYLGEEKKREADPRIRKMCIEALHQLCATKHGREVFQTKGIYYVLRELHKTEEDQSVVIACENLVDILISDEPAPEYSNLKEVHIPIDLANKFDKMNMDLLDQK